MEKQKLGRSGLEVMPLCFGGNVFGWTADEPTSFALLDAFLDAGFDFIDTADIYSAWAPGHTGGESETVLGNWLAARGNRSKVIIASKFGQWVPHFGLNRANVIASCEGSLKRLKTDYIDLYQTHREVDDTPQEETAEAYATLIKAGKVRAIGASNFEANRLASALEIAKSMNLPRYETLQPKYNMIEREFEAEIQPLCVREGISVIPHSSLATGFLTGKYRSLDDAKGKARERNVGKYFTPENMAVLARLEKVANARNATMAEVAIAWVRSRPAVAAPIASATSVEQLQSVMRGATLQLSAAEIAALDG